MASMNGDGKPNGQSSNGDSVPSIHPSFEVAFPQNQTGDSVLQDAEVFDVTVRQRIRIHDYDTLYSYPGLYDHVIEGTLQCQSPQQLVSLLRRHLNPHVPSSSRARLRILDIAAGNGRVGVELRSQLGKTPGIERLMATDLLDSAKTAALRDRETSLYDEYIVADLTQPKIVQRFRGEGFNVATICAALGSGDGDLPLEVIDTAIEILQSGGVLAFTVNEGAGGDVSARYGEFLDCVRRDADGTHWGNMRKIEMERYRHRLNVKGEWIVYTALLYQKMV